MSPPLGKQFLPQKKKGFFWCALFPFFPFLPHLPSAVM